MERTLQLYLNSCLMLKLLIRIRKPEFLGADRVDQVVEHC
jgi:hypothetical protein